MSFVLTKKIKEVDWLVTVNVPVDGGKTEDHEFTARFKLLSDDDYNKAVQEAASDTDLISKILIGWEGLIDDDGKAVKYSKKTLKDLCKFPFVRNSIVRAYTQAIQGIAAKN